MKCANRQTWNLVCIDTSKKIPLKFKGCLLLFTCLHSLPLLSSINVHLARFWAPYRVMIIALGKATSCNMVDVYRPFREKWWLQQSAHTYQPTMLHNPLKTLMFKSYLCLLTEQFLAYSCRLCKCIKVACFSGNGFRSTATCAHR
jgi:hypothetical protein